MLLKSSTILINPNKITYIEHHERRVVIRFADSSSNMLNLKYETEMDARKEFDNLHAHIDKTPDHQLK